MRAHILALLQHATAHRLAAGALSSVSLGDIPLERTRDPAHGDFSSSLALSLAKAARCKPRDLATDIIAALPPSEWVTKAEVAGPGFINFFLAPTAYHALVADILAKADTFGQSTLGQGQRVQVEFVSANPTGPLHVGHGRGAAFGATLANVLEAAGYQVQREYYVNDAGRQMDILATSLWLRYLSRAGAPIPFPSNGYRGQYIIDMADDLFTAHGTALVVPVDAVLSGLPPDETNTPDGTVGDKEAHIDALIGKAKALLGGDRYRTVFDQALNTILADIRADLAAFAVTYDEWYSERVLTETFAIEQVLNTLDAGGHLYTQDGAVWFRSTAFGDEKDRVVRRENGQTTYFASDIAYHAEKFARGFDRVIDVWGADHHGYIPRVKAALQALGLPAERLQVLLVQFAILYRQGERAQMSTRSGEFVTLRDLCREVGNDAARFFYVMRKSEQHMDFDLDLATSQSKDNPVYYLQYAHARVCSVLRQLAEKGLSFDPARGLQQLNLLTQPHEIALMVALSRYPEVLEAAAVACEPHQLAHTLRDIANAFHTCYNEHRVLVPEDALRDARLTLGVATRQVLRNGLRLLGVSAPEVM